MQKSQRIEFIDILRGIGILYMIIGHMSFFENSQFNYYIHGFHMPLFFIVSGYFFKKSEPFTSFILKKIKSILVPYFSLLILFFLISAIINREEKSVINDFLSIFTFNNHNLPLSQAMWFLSALFFAELLFYFICKIKFKIGRLCAVVIISTIGVILKQNFDFELILSINQSLVGVGFLYLGNLFSKDIKICNVLKNINIIACIILLVINYFMIINSPYINMRNCRYNGLLFWVNSYISFILYYNVSKKIDSCQIKIIKYILNFLKYIGKNSLVYLCFNQIVINIVQIVLCKLSMYDYTIIYLIMLFSIVFGALYVICQILNKTKLKLLLGRW